MFPHGLTGLRGLPPPSCSRYMQYWRPSVEMIARATPWDGCSRARFATVGHDIYICVMPYGSVHELHTLCLPTVDRGRPFIVERAMQRDLSGEWTAAEAVQHITRGDAMGPPRAFSPYPCRPVTRLKYHPVPVRTVARTRFANRLVSTMSDAENLLNACQITIPVICGARAPEVFLFRGCPNRVFLCIVSPRARKFGTRNPDYCLTTMQS